MKRTFVYIFAMLLVQTATAESRVECGTRVSGENPFSQNSDIEVDVFDISACESHTQVFKAIEDWIREDVESAGLEFNDMYYAESDIDSAIVFLEEDYSTSDGDEPWEPEQIEKLVELYTSPSMHKDLWMGEFYENYMGGSGVTGLLFLQNQEVDRIYMIQKFIYAE